MLAIEVHIALMVYAVELNEHFSARRLGRHRKVLAIPADAAGQESHPRAVLDVLIERSLDAPVMRHVEPPPVSISKIGLRGRRRIAFEEQPIEVEFDFAGGAGLGKVGLDHLRASRIKPK